MTDPNPMTDPAEAVERVKLFRSALKHTGVFAAALAAAYDVAFEVSYPVAHDQFAADLEALLTAKEAGERERDAARVVVRETLWMARRYADGRQSYAVGMFNDAARIAVAGGYASGEPDGLMFAADGSKPEHQTLESRAQAAEAKAATLVEALRTARRFVDLDVKGDIWAGANEALQEIDAALSATQDQPAQPSVEKS